MGLNKKAIKEFQEIYYQEFKEEISDEKAQEMGESLISLFKIIYRPIPKEVKHDPRDRSNNNPSST